MFGNATIIADIAIAKIKVIESILWLVFIMFLSSPNVYEEYETLFLLLSDL